MDAIDTADVVYHRPTDEEWVVAYVRGDRLAWCGWPPGEAKLSDCSLKSKAAPEERLKLLRSLAAISGNDNRALYARARLEEDVDQGPDHGEYPSGEMYAARW